MIYLTNALSVHMLEKMHCGNKCRLDLERISCEQAKDFLHGNKFKSYFGHRDTAAHLERYLRLRIPITREYVRIGEDDMVIIATLGSTREFEQEKRPNRMFEFYLLRYRNQE